MLKVHLGKKNEPAITLEQSDDLIVVRTRSGKSIARSANPVPTPIEAELDDAVPVVEYPEVGVSVYRIPAKGTRSLDQRKTALRALPDVRFAGGVLVDPNSRQPVLYTENLFLKFVDSADPEECEDVVREAGLRIKQRVTYATNAYFVEAPEGIGQRIFEVSEELLGRDQVEYCHPELIRPRARKAVFPQQWHLKKTLINGVEINAHSHVEEAHALSQGEGVTIAVIDDGIDIDHVEFSGAGKIVSPRDATLLTDDPRPKDIFGTGPNGDNHGTACAGVACASGKSGASGVAPKARLMPIRLASGLGSQNEANAFVWAADHGADVISCSWGPADGPWWKPSDPQHQVLVPLPASTRLALDYATSQGRQGKGCVVLFAAGNGNESVEKDGYASYDKVIAVAACNDRGTRSIYSDFGESVWCAFPSNDIGYAPLSSPEPLTPGIWTTDRTGTAGYNSGHVADGDPAGNFTNSFGGTSSACPGAAGVVALVLGVNPDLKREEVRDLLKSSADRIDPQGGAYDAKGHSDKYGYGRLNARAAVELAKPSPRNAVTIARQFDAPIPDMQTVEFTIDVSDTPAVETLSIDVALLHTYIGDLIITLVPPATTEVNPIVLHNRVGGATKNLSRRYDKTNTSALAKFAGKRCKGRWILRIRDAAAQDSGTLTSFALNLTFPHAENRPATPVTVKVSRTSEPRAGENPPAKKRTLSRSRSRRAVA